MEDLSGNTAARVVRDGSRPQTIEEGNLTAMASLRKSPRTIQGKEYEEGEPYLQVESQPVGMQGLTEQGRRNYGDFPERMVVTSKMYEAFREYRIKMAVNGGPLPTPEVEASLDNVVRMICDKLTRAANDPAYEDNWADVVGYANLMLDAVRR